MKVWIDISNAPHARFFRDVIKYLEDEGEEVVVTARQLKCMALTLYQLENMVSVYMIS